MWRDQTKGVVSKGSQRVGPTRLADLHSKRAVTKGQYFTPQWVCEGIWRLLDGLVSNARRDERTLSVVDTSIGSGALLSFAALDVCNLYGLDSDERCIEALNQDAESAGLGFHFERGGLEDLTMEGFDIACINPPFSLHLESPSMSAYECTSYGRFGPNTASKSHEYALAQALDGSKVVVALLPWSMKEQCLKDERLSGIYKLPKNTFASEGAVVNTGVFIFNRRAQKSKPTVVEIGPDEIWPCMELDVGPVGRKTRFKTGNYEESAVTISREVTGNRTVGVHHHNRNIVLRFNCGLVEAKVRNGLLVGDVAPADLHRYPKNVNFKGDLRFSLDTWLLQEHQDRAFDDFVEEIRKLGGEPIVSKTLIGYWEKLKKRHIRAKEPFKQYVMRSQSVGDVATAKRSTLLRGGDLNSPAIRRGDVVEVECLGGEYRVTHQGEIATLSGDEFGRKFELQKSDSSSVARWEKISPGLNERFPELKKHWDAVLNQCDIDWLWPYQRDGAIELLVQPYGSVAAWRQGTGKARLAIALALASSGNSLIVVESALVAEMIIEIKEKLKLSNVLWQVIDKDMEPEGLALKSVNIISYNTLKRRVRRKKSVASVLRRRFGLVVADEGGILSNMDSQQSRALLALSPKKLVVSDGTPIGNYPRGILPIVGATAGDGQAHQPYGLRNKPFVEKRHNKSSSFAMRGVDEFREKHVVLEWATNEFRDGLKDGAKREVPRINNVVQFRRWLGPHVQRKVRYEPEVEKYAGCPKPIYETEEVPWDQDHFAYYLNVAMNFAQWYQRHVRDRLLEGKGANLIAVLAKIGAVLAAANQPHADTKHGFGSYGPLTSKQRRTLQILEENNEEGRKTIVYAYSPRLVERLAAELSKKGIKSVLFHGEIPIKKRVRALDSEFRFGDTNVLLSTWCGQKGLNIPQAKVVLLYNRDWSGRTEDQAIHRTQRPDQTDHVLVKRLHLKGSIDEYVAQLVDWKVAASEAGLDWGDGVTETEVFRHLDSIIESFCKDTMDDDARNVLRNLVG